MKFSENHPKGSGDMERTRNSRVNPLTLTWKISIFQNISLTMATLNSFLFWIKMPLILNPFTAVYNARGMPGENTAILMLLWCYI